MPGYKIGDRPLKTPLTGDEKMPIQGNQTATPNSIKAYYEGLGWSFTGPYLRGPDGSAGAPGIGFASDPLMGLRRVSATQFNGVIGGLDYGLFTTAKLEWVGTITSSGGVAGFHAKDRGGVHPGFLFYSSAGIARIFNLQTFVDVLTIDGSTFAMAGPLSITGNLTVTGWASVATATADSHAVNRALAREMLALLGSAAFVALGDIVDRPFASSGSAVTLTNNDNRTFKVATGAATYTLPSAAECDRGWQCILKGRGGAITLNRAGSDTIDGTTTINIADGTAKTIIKTGATSFESF